MVSRFGLKQPEAREARALKVGGRRSASYVTVLTPATVRQLRILSKQFLESNQNFLSVLLESYFSDQVSIRFRIVTFPAIVFTFNQSRQRVNA